MKLSVVSRAFLSIIMLSGILFAQTLPSYADKLQYVSQNGTMTQDNQNYMSIYVNGNNYISSDTSIPPQVSGDVAISGNDGLMNINMGGHVVAMSFSQIKVNNVTYPVANIQTSKFNFIDLNTSRKILAYAKIQIIKNGHGILSFQVLDAKSNVTISGTITPDGQLQLVPLTTGTTVMRQ